jgi:hypothetical protein
LRDIFAPKITALDTQERSKYEEKLAVQMKARVTAEVSLKDMERKYQVRGVTLVLLRPRLVTKSLFLGDASKVFRAAARACDFTTTDSDEQRNWCVSLRQSQSFEAVSRAHAVLVNSGEDDKPTDTKLGDEDTRKPTDWTSRFLPILESDAEKPSLKLQHTIPVPARLSDARRPTTLSS